MNHVQMSTHIESPEKVNRVLICSKQNTLVLPLEIQHIDNDVGKRLKWQQEVARE